MKTIAWTFVVVLGAVSAVPIVLNYLLVWQEIRAKPGEKTPSLIPFVGGILGAFAVVFYFKISTWPNPSEWTPYALLPAALDPGCYLLYFLIMPVIRKIKR